MKVNIIHILRGWAKKWGLLPVSTAEQKLSALRLKQCNRCDLAKQSTVLKILDNSADWVDTAYCTKCNCPCEAKSLVTDEYCPIGKW
jgi:hypothetical protein